MHLDFGPQADEGSLPAPLRGQAHKAPGFAWGYLLVAAGAQDNAARSLCSPVATGSLTNHA